MYKRPVRSLIYALIILSMPFFSALSNAAEKRDFFGLEKQGIFPGLEGLEVNFWSYANGLTMKKIFDPSTGTYLDVISNDNYSIGPVSQTFTLRLYDYHSFFQVVDDVGGSSFILFFLHKNFVYIRDETTDKWLELEFDVVFQGNNWQDDKVFQIMREVKDAARFVRMNGKTIVLKFKIIGITYGLAKDSNGKSVFTAPMMFYISLEDSRFEDEGKG